MKFTIYQNSRQGPRPQNQDRIAYSYSKNAILAVVADGMGGHLHGEIAARFAVKMMTEAFQRMATPILADPFEFLVSQIDEVHKAIMDYVTSKDLIESPRTTLVAAVMQHDELFCVHIGDSRLYHIRDGKVIFCTEDHSKVQMLYRKGLITKEEIATHPERNKVYNCLGGETLPHVDMAMKRTLWNGDVVVLCTDGLWSQLEDGELAEMLNRGAVTDSMPSLLDLAGLRAGRHGDNMSVVALNWGGGVQDFPQISTATMPMDLNTTIMYPATDIDADASEADEARTAGDLTDEEIDNSVAEIQAAIKNSVR